MTNSVARDKRERLMAAAGELIYRQGIERTTLAHIAGSANVPLGNVYYYFKTKDDIVTAVVEARVDELSAAFQELERNHRSPRARLKALIGFVAEQRESIASFGCRYGTLSAELAKRADSGKPLAARLMQALLDWTEAQFTSLGRGDAHELAVELIAAYQGAAVLAGGLGRPDIMAGQARRLQRWIDTIARPGEKSG